MPDTRPSALPMAIISFRSPCVDMRRIMSGTRASLLSMSYAVEAHVLIGEEFMSETSIGLPSMTAIRHGRP